MRVVGRGADRDGPGGTAVAVAETAEQRRNWLSTYVCQAVGILLWDDLVGFPSQADSGLYINMA